MTKHALASLAIILVTASASATTLTLDQALTRALEANPSVTRAQSDVALTTAQRRVAKTAILPRLDLDVTAMRNHREIAFPLEQTEVALQPESNETATITLRQPLYAGGRELKAIRQMALVIDGAKAVERSTEETILLRTAADYLAVVEAAALIDVERQTVALAAGRRELAQRLFNAGEVTKLDVLRAEAAAKGAERQLAAAEQTMADVESLLRLDLATDDEIEVVAPALELAPVPPVDALVAAALASHPDVVRAEATLEVARLETRKQRGARLPTVTLEATLTRQSLDYPFDENRAASVKLHLPIFDSGEISSRVAIAKERETQTAASLAETRQAVREALVRSVASLETARRSLELARQQLAASEGEYQQIAALYRSQEATSLDIDSAETSLAEARRAVVLGALEAKLAELRVWHAAGSLKSTLLSKEH
jgi:outer membrane protein